MKFRRGGAWSQIDDQILVTVQILLWIPDCPGFLLPGHSTVHGGRLRVLVTYNLDFLFSTNEQFVIIILMTVWR